MCAAMNARKVALVTGSGKKRVGWHVADALAERGFALALHFRTSLAEATKNAAAFQQRGIEVLSLQADLADEPSVKAMVQKIIEHFGRFDVLVNTAAVWQRKRLEEVTAADVRAHFETNTLGRLLAGQHAGQALQKPTDGVTRVQLRHRAQ